MRRNLTLAVVVSVVTVVAGAGAVPQQGPATRATPIITEAFQAVYNLDHEQAIAIARRAVAAAPEEPASHRTLAAMIWLQILYRRGSVSIDHYLGGITRSDIDFPKPAPEVAAEFQKELDQAIALADERVRRGPNDVQARFDLGAGYALKASYTASVDGKLTAAFSSAKRAFDEQETVLERDPKRTDAGLVVGVYRYIVASVSWPTRMVAYIAGFGGDKAKAIKLLEAAAQNPSTRVDARTALMLVFSREGRHDEVERLARELRQELPRNRLLFLEEGAAAIRAGHAAAADEVITRGLAAFAKDPRQKLPGERAQWLYKRGLARVNLNRLAEASVDLNEALASQPLGWIKGRSHVELGKIDDLGGRRAEALKHYETARTTCETSRDPLCANEAARFIRKPFRFDK